MELSRHLAGVAGRGGLAGATRRGWRWRHPRAAAAAANPSARARGLSAAAAAPAGGWDYVVAGGGTAGCVLADRLSAGGGKRVLVLEAGPDETGHPHIRIPAGILRLFKSRFDWDYNSRGEAGLKAGKSVYLCRGKVLGGSSCANVMLYNRGAAEDYEGWGLDGWGAAECLKYFRKSEGFHKGASEFHGGDGPFKVSDVPYQNVLSKAFLDACQAMGLARNDDFNNWKRAQEGFGRFQVSQSRGERCSAASSYMANAAKRENLHVETEATITRLNVDGGDVRGVVYVDRHGAEQYAALAAGGEAVLTAGAIGSPQLLMLSGIGAADHLRDVGVRPVVDLPAVGRNLQDQPAAVVSYQIDRPVSVTDDIRLGGWPNPMSFLRWYLFRSGPLTSPGCDHGGFFSTTGRAALPDLQIRFIAAQASSPDGVSTYKNFGRGWGGAKFRSGFSFQPICVRPKSRGKLELTGGTIHDKPAITTGYLAEDSDARTIVEGIKLSREIARQGPLAGYVEDEVFPGAGVEKDDDLLDYIKANAHSANAITGTCRMGVGRDSAVVDTSLNVFGVGNLRIADASVMPTIPGGQTAASTVMIAEKAADMILAKAEAA